MNWACPDRHLIPAAGVAVLLVLLALAAPAAGGRALLQGRVVRDGRPVPGAAVYAHQKADLSDTPEAVAAPSSPEGLYSLRLAPGRYILAAARSDLWCYSGQNPVTLQEGDRTWVGFELASWADPVRAKLAESPAEGAIRGRVTLRGKPVGGVTVSLYLDAADFFRGPPFLSVPTAEDGTFALDLVPESRYFLVARRRESGQAVGPMSKGDLFAYCRGNPLAVRGGEALQVMLPLQEKRVEKDGNAASPVRREAGFSGVIQDREGKPLRGLHVFAYREPEMGHHKPAAVSSASDAKGRYSLILPGPGTYYLGAREKYGDSPSPGESFGFWQGDPRHSLTLGDGEFRGGIDITVEKVLE